MPTSDIAIRDATVADAATIAELYRLSSGGVADYVWTSLAPDYPGLTLLEVGAKRYARENTEFSYRNCLLAEAGGRTVAMLHGYVMTGDGSVADDMDPVLRPYAELEHQGSFYVSGLAVKPEHQGRGIGTRMMAAAEEKARALGCPSLSLIVFEGNQGAGRLYKRLGLVETKRRAVVPHELIHYRGDAILLVHTLD